MPILHIRIPDNLARALEDRRQNADLNVSAFCRRAIERELVRPVVDAEPERRALSPAPVLVAQKASE